VNAGNLSSVTEQNTV